MLEFFTTIIGEFTNFLVTVFTSVMDGFLFLITIFTYIPGLILLNFFGELPFFFKYGLYSLFCVLMFVLLMKLYALIKMK